VRTAALLVAAFAVGAYVTTFVRDLGALLEVV
jgi:hypothetical protein